MSRLAFNGWIPIALCPSPSSQVQVHFCDVLDRFLWFNHGIEGEVRGEEFSRPPLRLSKTIGPKSKIQNIPNVLSWVFDHLGLGHMGNGIHPLTPDPSLLNSLLKSSLSSSKIPVRKTNSFLQSMLTNCFSPDSAIPHTGT